MPSSDDLPALLGGSAVRPQGPPSWRPADPEVLEALQAAYRDGSWGTYHGPNVERLEAALREYHQIDFALACASGTFAVELALRALKIGPGDEVILAAYDYPGNFLSVHAVGAHPVLVDVEADNWNLRVDFLADAVSPQTRAIIVSHLHGGMVPMREVMEFAHSKGLAVIEDAAQAPGAMIQGRMAGTWGDAGVLSFGGSKLLSAGRGGALLTPRADAAQRARTWHFRGNLIAPLSELQAAVVVPQLAKLDARNQSRLRAVQELTQRLQSDPGLRPFRNTVECQPGYYKVGFQYDAAVFGLSRQKLVCALRAEGIAMDEGFHSLHVGRSPKRFRQVGELPEATRAHEGTIILHHPVLLEETSRLDEVATAIRKVHAHAARLAE
jgi:dTDP-4-amino-4,6-dideoxygalactose transaminase